MISAPSIFGKLPALGDYLRHNAPLNQVEAWRRWFDAACIEPSSRRVFVADAERAPALKHDATATATATAAESDVAVSTIRPARPCFFLLSARGLGFPADGYVVGVVTTSRDRGGRRYPVIIWQAASWYWVEQILDAPASWLSSLASLVHEHIHFPDAADFAKSVDGLWAEHRPHWRNRFGIHFKQKADPRNGVAVGIQLRMRVIVRRDWPQSLIRRGGFGCLWQADGADAAYVSGEVDLIRLISEL